MQIIGKRSAIVTAIVFSSLSTVTTASAQVGALQTDCSLGGTLDSGAYQFVATCAGRAASPNGRLAVVQHAYDDKQPPIELQDAQGQVVAHLPSLSDDMPFSISWSRDSHWFFANHHVGSFMDTLKVFQILNGLPVERPELAKAAIRTATQRYPCLGPEWVNPYGVRWTKDGRGVIIVTLSAAYACDPDFSSAPGEWKPLWMIGDVVTGSIDPASIRIQASDGPLKTPTDGPYGLR